MLNPNASIARGPFRAPRWAARSLDNGVGEVELPVKLERPGLNGERPRTRAGRLSLVEDPHLGAELREPSASANPDPVPQSGESGRRLATFPPQACQRYGAWARRFRAISRAQREPFASSRSLALDDARRRTVAVKHRDWGLFLAEPPEEGAAEPRGQAAGGQCPDPAPACRPEHPAPAFRPASAVGSHRAREWE